MAEPPATSTVPDEVRYQNPNPISLWASSNKVHLRHSDNDVRLPNNDWRDRTVGQARWMVGLDFSNFAHLGNCLANGGFSLPAFVCGNTLRSCGPITENQICRLAIHAHGAPGAVDVDGVLSFSQNGSGADQPNLLNLTTMNRYSRQLDQVFWALGYNARVFFMSCVTASGNDIDQTPWYGSTKGRAGETLLKQLSERWIDKNVTVIAFTTVGYTGSSQLKPGTQGASCYAGMRETTYAENRDPRATYPAPRPYETPEYWNDLSKLPWASEYTPHATIAQRGMILKRGLDGTF